MELFTNFANTLKKFFGALASRYLNRIGTGNFANAESI
jgi:hypothetical protein